MLELNNISIMVGSRTLIDDASVTIFPGDKVGIVGHNGCGKTTLLKAITGDLAIDSGSIFLAKNIKLVCVRQEIADKTVKLLDFVVSADEQLVILKNKLHDHNENIAEIYDQISAIGGNSADARASAILAGLGFKNGDLDKKLSEFSGGWQVRASLAATLFAPSDIIILDEPTNHLDLESVIWLESFLEASSKTLLIVSHEKAFLDGICNKIVSIDNAQLKVYSGNYSTFIKTKMEQEQALLRTIESQKQKREHIQSFVNRFRYKASKARQVQSRIKMLNKVEILEFPVTNYDVKFQFDEPYPKIDRRLIALENISAGYGNKMVLHDVFLHVDFGERIAFLGANGNGKSTLAKIIADRLSPFSGKIERARNLKIAYFSQQQTDELDVNLTAMEMFHVYHPEQTETQMRAALANFGLIQARSQTKIELLSGGEKTRLLLAIITSQHPHMLILDEPTNHLDIEAREALVDALKKYDGAAILITHDFHTLEECCNNFYIICDGTCNQFKGNLEDYKSFLLTQREISPKEEKKKVLQSKRTDKKLLKQISTLEEKIRDLTEEKNELELKLSEAYSVVSYDKYSDVTQKLSSVEEEWLSLMELIEKGQ